MNESSSFYSQLQRGIMLRGMGRFREAEGLFQAAIAAAPDNAEGYYQLAFCYTNWDNHSKQALSAIDRAISLAPHRAPFFALRSWILVNLKKYKQAIPVAEQALALAPSETLAWNAKSRAYCAQSKWRELEGNARSTLEFDPENDQALNFHAIALRRLGRRAEGDEVIAQLLARVPEDPTAQTNAGWSALEAGDHRRANEHFLTALRLDPHYEYARLGLLHSFNSRVWFYRIYLGLITRLSKMQGAGRIGTLLFIYIAYRAVVITLERYYGRIGFEVATVIIGFYVITFVFGRSYGNLFLLLDRFARHALTTREKCWSVVAALVYGVLIFASIADQSWIPLAFLLVPPACFLWSVLVPQMQDWFTPQSDEFAAIEETTSDPTTPESS